MTQSLSWNLHGNDQLSGVLERLDRTVSKLDRTMQAGSSAAREYGRAVGTAEAPTARFGGNLNQTSSKLEGVTSKVIALGTALRTMAITAGVAMAGAAATAGIFGIKMAAANEDAAISFELMLGSAKKAQDFLKQLQDFAAATPFEMPQLRSAASRLLAVGTTAKDIIPILTALGDATAGMGTGAEGIERAVTALTQMRQKTKVTGEEMMQLTEAGIPAWETLAAKLGVTTAKAMEMVTARKVEAGVIFDAIEQRTGTSMQRLSGMMKRQSTTLNGIWSTFKDNAGQALATFMQPAMPGIKKLIDFASVAVPKLLNYFADLRAQVGSIFKDSPVPDQVMRALREAGEKLVPRLKQAFEMVVTTVKENREGLEKFGRFLADVVIPVGGRMVEMLILITAGFVSLSVVITSHVVGALRFLVQKADEAMLQILDAEVKMFGWVPVLGDKLKEAQRDFQKFVAGVNTELDKLDGKTVDVWINTHARGVTGEHSGSGSGSGSTAIVSGTVASFGSNPISSTQQKDRAHGAYEIPSFDSGGLVPGPYGSPQLILAHGGERVLTTAQQGDDIIGVLRVVHQTPDGHTLREELLALKRRRGLGGLGLA